MTSAHRARENSGCKEAAGLFAVCGGALISGGLLQRELLGGLGVPASLEKQRRSARWWPRRGQPWGCLPPARALEGPAAKSRRFAAFLLLFQGNRLCPHLLLANEGKCWQEDPF